jgi:hypothetical protein
VQSSDIVLLIKNDGVWCRSGNCALDAEVVRLDARGGCVGGAGIGSCWKSCLSCRGGRNRRTATLRAVARVSLGKRFDSFGSVSCYELDSILVDTGCDLMVDGNFGPGARGRQIDSAGKQWQCRGFEAQLCSGYAGTHQAGANQVARLSVTA